jgi:hypothetical protein
MLHAVVYMLQRPYTKPRDIGHDKLNTVGIK